MSTAPTPTDLGARVPARYPFTPAPTAAATEAPAPAIIANMAPERPGKAWRSGWCGPGPTCRDGNAVDKHGEAIRRCLGTAINGAKATRPTASCACTCHAEPTDR